MLPKLVIWGASGHAMVVADIVRLTGRYQIVGFLDDVNPERWGSEFFGLPVLGGREQLSELRRDGVDHLIVAIGNCPARLELAEFACRAGFVLPTVVHPRSVVAEGVSIGAGTVIAAGAVVNSGAVIGDNVIINTLAGVDHECVIESGAHICPGVHLAGNVTVGRASSVGIGSAVREKIRIGSGTVIGAGSVVVTDIPDGVVAFGAPAKVKRGKDGNER